ncbi:NlpC/P60 family protein [Microbacterium sp. JZ31]|uniref:NlpC/P60 family protein n=1 Tax=Microbacterium sp. JZ31 TaxID=1906274 RepID=UPI001932EACB|nr:NlpC/P60 family protein [Microbacterium sp. JZ31]
MATRRSRVTAALSAAVLIATLTVVAQNPPPAHAQGGEVGGHGTTYYLNDAWSGSANIVAKYGVSSDRAYVGDWNGDGKDTLAVRRGNKYYLTNTAGSPATKTFTFGLARDTALVGDWNGDGKDTLAVRRGNHYFLSNTLGGRSTQNFHFGRAGDQVLVGDWNGDGKDTLAVRRGKTFYLSDRLTGGKASRVVAYGRAGDRVYVGDWNGDRSDTPAVRRGNAYYITNRFAPGRAERVLSYGRTTDMTLVGDWNGDRKDTLGVRRGAPIYQTPGNYAKISYTGQPPARGAGFNLTSGREGAKVKVIADRFGLARPTQWVDSTMMSKVKQWQRAHGIPQTGVVGKRTWLAMGYSESSWTGLDNYVYPLKARPNMTRKQLINAMIATARSYEGSRYVWGGSNQPAVGADCVGVVMQALLSVGINVEPSNTVTHTLAGNTTPREIYANRKFKHVPYSQRLPGDLIFQAHDPRDPRSVRHVQMYLGNGMVMESVHVGGIVRRENITYPASKNMPTVVRPLP